MLCLSDVRSGGRVILRTANHGGGGQHMSRNDVDKPAGRAEAGRAAGSAEPTREERAAAATVLQMILGIHISRAVSAVAALGIADLLADGPMTAAQLAQATQAHEGSLYRVLRLLASLGRADRA